MCKRLIHNERGQLVVIKVFRSMRSIRLTLRTLPAPDMNSSPEEPNKMPIGVNPIVPRDTPRS